MIGKKKRRLVWYLPWDGTYAERHLEKMARKGWRLENAGNPFWIYRRAEPANLRYAITYFPTASVFDSGPTGDQMTYADYCAAAGWEMVSAYGPLQIFVNDRPNPVPIETDEREKLAAIHGAMKKMLLLPDGALAAVWLVNLLMRLNPRSYYSILSTFSSNQQLLLLLAIALLLLLSLGMMGDYLVWYLRSRRAVERGGACLPSHTLPRMIFQGTILAIAMAALLGPFAYASGGRGLLFILAVLATASLFLAGAYGLLRLLKSMDGSRSFNRGVYIAGSVVLSILYTVVVVKGVTALMPKAEPRASAEVYTEETEWGSRNYGIYRDDLPLTLEDLGYTVTEADHCSYRREEQTSSLVRWVQYSQYVYGEDSVLPELEYDTADIPWDWLRELCWGRLARYFDFTETDPGPWAADRAIMDEGATGYRRYLFLYGERIVFLFLEEAPTAEQMAVISRNLRP
mgnify:CR=1 FL=1